MSVTSHLIRTVWSTALRHAGLDRGDPPVPLSWVVVTRIDDDQFVRLSLKQAGRQVGYVSGV
jgi:hypothetical protein